jgi:hypothetical protein
MNWLYTILLFVLPLPALAATYTVAAGSSSSTIQAILNSAPTGSTIAFEEGTYTISSTLIIPCNNLTITGPVAFPNTAILNASFNNTGIFTMWGGCTGMTLEYLAGYNAGLLYVGPGNSSNINFLHNTTGSLPSSATNISQYGTSGSVYFDGKVGQTLSNVTIEYNSFGDTNSCTAVFTLANDTGGACAGILIHQGVTTNITIKYNRFFHLEEGMHVFQAAGDYVPGAPQSASDNLDVEYNYFLNIHRIEVEIQEGTINHPTIVSNNIFQDQSYAYYGSLGLSTPCCQWSTITASAGLNPGLMENNNVSISSLKSQYGCTFCGAASNSGPAFAHEYWGTGSHADNNLIQGNFGNGIEWGYGAGSWEIKNNQICGPNMALNRGNEANYISNEEGQNNAPTQSGNVTSATCGAITSVTPTISEAVVNGRQMITLADPGLTSGPGPQGNTSIYYTTDGSNPVPGSGATHLYTGPFSMAPGTAKAVGLYGAGGTNPQTWPTTYPTGYGYVPSPVVTASITGTPGGAPTPTLVSVSLSTPGSTVTMVTGSTLQFSAIGKYSDGSVASLPDAYGNTVSSWTSSSTQVGSISSGGMVTAVASGTTNIQAKIGNIVASPRELTVTAAPVSQNPSATLVRAYLGMPAPQNTMVAGSTLQFTAYGVYSDGAVATLPDTHGNAVTTWTSSSTQVGSINSGGMVTAVASGTTNIQAKIGKIVASPWGVTVTAAPVSPNPATTLVRAYLGMPAPQNTMVVGSTLQFTAYGVYSDGSVATLPDAHGNAVTAWTSTSTQVGSIDSGGMATAVGAGTTSIWAAVGSLTASSWGITVTNGPPVSGPTSPGSPLGDTFLGPFWKLLSPVGGTVSISNDHLFLNVPGGSNHDTSAPGNHAVRVMQAIGNYDFDVAIKIDSALVAGNEGTKEGLMVTSDAKDFITFELATDGTNLHLSAETVTNGSAAAVLDITNFSQSQSPMYLRLSRAGSAYIAYYSIDGTTWIQATSFTDTNTPRSIGLFGSNYNESPAMASPISMSVNWFHSQY